MTWNPSMPPFTTGLPVAPLATWNVLRDNLAFLGDLVNAPGAFRLNGKGGAYLQFYAGAPSVGGTIPLVAPPAIGRPICAFWVVTTSTGGAPGANAILARPNSGSVSITLYSVSPITVTLTLNSAGALSWSVTGGTASLTMWIMVYT